MIMTYVGALKTWLYAPVFAIWKPSAWSIRLPMVLAGALTIWTFSLLLYRLASRRAAIAGALLLATEPVYLITTTYDWGPTGLQILLLTAALWSASTRKYLLAAFLLGLGMWNKAIFGWTMAGLGGSLLLVYPREVWRALHSKRTALAALCFVLGALPLLSYNIRRPLKTFKGNTKLAVANIDSKWIHIPLSANGSGLFGYIAGEEYFENPKPAAGAIAHWGGVLRDRIGEHRKTISVYVFGLAVLLTPFWWRVRRGGSGPLPDGRGSAGAGRGPVAASVGSAGARVNPTTASGDSETEQSPLEPPGAAEHGPEFESPRKPLVFALVFLVVAWLMMAMTADAGGAAHHVMLLWPMPILFTVVALSAALRPASLFTAIIAVMVVSNLLVVNQYIVQFARFGSAGVWSDAIFDLSKQVTATGAKRVYTVDWGMVNTVRLLTEGSVRPSMASDPPLQKEPAGPDRDHMLRLLADPDAVFVNHTEAFEEYKGAAQVVSKLAAEAGFSREVVLTVADTNGRPVFEIARFRKRGGGE